MRTIAIILQLLLVTWIILVRPYQRRQELHELSSNFSVSKQIILYKNYIVRSIVIMCCTGFFLHIQGATVCMSMAIPGPTLFLLTGLMLALAATVILYRGSAHARRFFLWQLSKFDYTSIIIPISVRSARWFILVALTAGVYEEFLFRGVIPAIMKNLDFLQSNGIWGPLLLSSLAFGAVHLYQGIYGVLATALFGAWMYVETQRAGTLVPAMVIHALFDLRFGILFYTSLSRSQHLDS